MGTYRSELTYRACAASAEFGAKQLTSRLRHDMDIWTAEADTAGGYTTVAASVGR